QGELVICEMGLAHQVLEGYRPSVTARRLAPGHQEVPVDVAVVERAPSLAVSNGEDAAEVVAVTRLARDGGGPRSARQIAGAPAQLVGELMRVVPLDLGLRDVGLGLYRLRHHVQAPADEDEHRHGDDEKPRLDGHAASSPMSWRRGLIF